MTSRDNPLPRKHSTENKDLITTNPSIQSSLGSNPTVFTETEEVHLPIGLEDKTSTYTTRSNQFGFEEHQEKRYKDDLEEEKTSPEAANSNKREGFTDPGPQILSPDAFPQYDSPERNFDELRREQADREGHKIYGKYFEEYQKKYPSDLQHLRVSKQLSSPEMKKSDMPAFRRICNNNSLGDTIISEFTQGPIPDKESNSKSSKMSSNENLVNLERPENIESGIKRQTIIKEERKESMTLKDIDSSINNTTSNLRIDADILKNSELEALAKKRAQKMNAPMDFNVMVAGASGLGKSTFIDCFLESKYHVQHAIRPKTKEICEKTGSRTYNGMTFNINLIDTRGFTHSDSMEEWYREIRSEITRRFDEYKAEKEKSETQKRPQGLRTKDRRIHLLLYFFSGHRIESKDLQAMKKLQKYCAIVPILAKGDLFSLDEVREIKQSLLEKQKIYKLEWFDFHAALKNDQLKLNEFNNSRFGPCPPFVIVSSVNKVKIGSNLYVMGREYVWGVCNIENPNHSDFKLLQSLLGGFICFDAVQNTRLYYKEYKKAAKERKKKDEEKDRQKTQIGIGAAVAIGLVGTVFALKKKFTF